MTIQRMCYPLPETLFNVTAPYMSSTSRSPSTPVTMISHQFTARSFKRSDVPAPRPSFDGVHLRIRVDVTRCFLLHRKSSALRSTALRPPHPPPSLRAFSGFRTARFHHHSFPSYAFTVNPPFTRLTFTPRRREDRSASPECGPARCVWPV